MSLVAEALTLLSAVGAATAAGAFFTFSTFTIEGLRRLEPAGARPPNGKTAPGRGPGACYPRAPSTPGPDRFHRPRRPVPRTLITGATGFLGRNILFRYLEQEENSRFALLVRGGDRGSPDQRVRRLLTDRYGEERGAELGKRVDCAPGDVTWERFGLDEQAYAELAADTDRVIHAAASVAFDLPLEQARAINVGGTRNVLDFCEAAGSAGDFRRLDYVGTAYVAGGREGTVLECELEKGQTFHNTYERTKCEAEALVRARWGTIPTTIHRPSIIVGESRTGKTSSFNVLYFPLKIYARGIWRWIPGSAETELDVVPVDWVCDAFMAISATDRSLGKAFHLAAGDRSSTLGQITDMAADYFGCRPISYVPTAFYMKVVVPGIDLLTRPSPRLHDMLAVKGALYLPYFYMRLHFDTAEARSVLDEAGVEIPRVDEYFKQIFQYCLDTDWGRSLRDTTD